MLNSTEEAIQGVNGSMGNRKPVRKEKKKSPNAYASILVNLLPNALLHGFWDVCRQDYTFSALRKNVYNTSVKEIWIQSDLIFLVDESFSP